MLLFMKTTHPVIIVGGSILSQVNKMKHVSQSWTLTGNLTPAPLEGLIWWTKAADSNWFRLLCLEACIIGSFVNSPCIS